MQGQTDDSGNKDGCCTNLIATAVIKVVVCSKTCNDIDAVFLCSCKDFWDVVRVDDGCLGGGRVDEEVGVVVVSDGDGDDFDHVER